MIYVAPYLTLSSFIFTSLLFNPEETGELCRELKVPGRITLVPAVIAVTWPLLAVIFLAALVYHLISAEWPLRRWV